MRLSLYSVVAVLLLFAAAYTARPRQSPHQPSSTTADAMEGAYRDGLYLGRLHRNQGLPSHSAVGRWSREADRRLFMEGYDRGYRDTRQ
jgi:hypothetical protein